MGSNGSKITDQDRAILDMKIQRDKLHQYQKKISIVLERETEIAKECLAKKDKRRALLALRKRKYQEQLLNKTDEQLEVLENLTQSIEFALVQKDVLFGLEQGNKVLKQINHEMSMERTERILDDSAEAIAYQNEISEMLSSNISQADEDEVQAELEALEREEVAQRLNIPDAPKADLASVAKQEQNEIDQEDEEEHVRERQQHAPLAA